MDELLEKERRRFVHLEGSVANSRDLAAGLAAGSSRHKDHYACMASALNGALKNPVMVSLDDLTQGKKPSYAKATSIDEDAYLDEERQAFCEIKEACVVLQTHIKETAEKVSYGSKAMSSYSAMIDAIHDAIQEHLDPVYQEIIEEEARRGDDDNDQERRQYQAARSGVQFG